MLDDATGGTAPRAPRASILRATKAETLAALRVHDPTLVPDLWHFPAAAWPRARAAIVLRVLASLHGARLAVRSATHAEDREGASRAGHFRSVLDVPRTPAALARAVDAVVASFEGDPADRVLVQDMAHDVIASGVLLTRDPVGGGPYLVFEYDEGSATDAVTRGATTPRRLVLHRSVRSRDLADPRLRRLVVLARRIERLAARSALDLEIAERSGGRLAVLQVRALASTHTPGLDRRVDGVLADVARELAQRSRPRRGLAGHATILGQMPDWNPAELIGTFPSPLAGSLFAHLVTDDVWQRARAAMGYRPLPGVALVTILGGRPWVDVRASFNSFLPSGLDAATAGALVDAWLERLRRNPTLHDAVELEVAQTVHDFAFHPTHAARYGGMLTRGALARYQARLGALTARMVDLACRASLSRALAAAQAGEVERRRCAARSTRDELREALALLAACRAHGTLPFAVVARHAFAGEALLRSAVARGALEPERATALRASIRTVASDVARDFVAAARGRLPRASFLARWGHLRPGSFDVTSRRYDARPELFDDLPTGAADASEVGSVPQPFVLTSREASALDALCREHALRVDGAGLVAYVARAVAGREDVKLGLTRPLSAALELLAAWAARRGLDRDALAHLTLDDLRAAAVRPGEHDARALEERIAERRARRAVERAVRLGPLLRDARDLHVLADEPARPTFVTRHVVCAPPVVLDASSVSARSLAGRVVCIQSADPGYDWIFAQPIAALVTCFGGGNSHMAIRCLELRVPAAIGVGEPLFDRICGAPRVELRCDDRLVRCIGHDASV